MKPISEGFGPERYTLYFPIGFSDRKGSVDFAIISPTLSLRLDKEVEVIKRDQYILILRVANHATEEDAEKNFQALKRLCDIITLEIGIPIFTYDTIYSTTEPITPFPSCVPDSWPEAISAGWQSDKNAGAFLLHGMVNIFFPCIVAEHKNIVDADALVANHITRRIEEKNLISIAASFTPQFTQGKHKSQAKTDLAMNAYLAALTQDDPSWKYCCFIAALDALSTQEDNSAELVSALEAIEVEIKSLPEKLSSIPEIEIAAKMALASINSKKKKTSVRQSFVGLLLKHELEIFSELPGDHPALTDGMAAWAGRAYDLRSRVAHNGGWGEYIDDHMHRANQLAQFSAKVVLRSKLAQE